MCVYALVTTIDGWHLKIKIRGINMDENLQDEMQDFFQANLELQNPAIDIGYK